jgi:hypothetical protein
MPNRTWKVISLDFIEGLPLSGGSNNCILVVVDRFSKYARFLSLKNPFTTVDVAKVFLAQAYKLHGCRLPWCLIVINFLLVHRGMSFLSWQRWICT